MVTPGCNKDEWNDPDTLYISLDGYRLETDTEYKDRLISHKFKLKNDQESWESWERLRAYYTYDKQLQDYDAALNAIMKNAKD